MISVRAVSKAFGRVRAVDGVSFEVGKGQVVGLLGANGAGKTTTIRMITGYLPPDAGAVAVGGHDTVREGPAARRGLGYLPESAPAYGEMAVEGYLDFRARLHGMGRAARRGAVERVTRECELGEVRGRRIGHLSRGYRQRVGLAAALVHDPPVLVLDEPTSALDPRQIGQTRALVKRLAREGGKAVLISSHILPEVEQTCDRVVILARGRVRADACPAELVGRVRETAPYLVEASGAPERVRRALEAVRAIERLEAVPTAEGWTRTRIVPRTGSGDLRQSLAAALAADGVAVRELTRETPSLERVFLQLIDSERPIGAAA